MDRATLTDCFVVPEGVRSREIDGETVVLNLDTGVYFGLDAVATDMWRSLQSGGSLDTIAGSLQATYEIDPAMLRADLLRLVDELLAKGLVRVAAEPSPSHA